MLDKYHLAQHLRKCIYKAYTRSFFLVSSSSSSFNLFRLFVALSRCTGSPFSSPPPLLALRLLSRSARTLQKPTLPSPPTSAQRQVVVSLRHSPSCLTPTGDGFTLLVATPTATPETPGTPPSVPTLRLAQPTALLTVPTIAEPTVSPPLVMLSP